MSTDVIPLPGDINRHVMDRYVYDICTPPDVDPLLFTPQPMDGEVETFEVSVFDVRA